MDQIELKEEVRKYWDNEACGTFLTNKEKFTLDYFNEIESSRYELIPEIHSFAQFTRFNGQKVLEVGVGASTDFIQWVRAGAIAYGIDLTQEAISHAQHRLDLYNLKAEDIRVADAENLPYVDNNFDLVYSWGVIHHSPNTIKALEEIIRVLRPGGKAKIMIYNRHSILSFLFWVKHALLKLRPWKSIAWVLWHKMESLGTKAYTINEFEAILTKYPVKNANVSSIFSYYDKMGSHSKLLQIASSILSSFVNRERTGWFLTIEFEKK